MREIAKVLHDDERVIWEGKPQATPYMASVLLVTLPGILFLIFLGFSFSLGSTEVSFFDAVFSFGIFIPTIIVLGPLVYGIWLYQHLWYAITDKRFLLQKGVIGRDFESVNHDKIENATVNVGVIDKIFGKNSGTILVYTTRVSSSGRSGSESVPFRMRHVTDPYETFDILKRVSLDVRTDIEFPNAMRPEENKGYHTNYRSEKKRRN